MTIVYHSTDLGLVIHGDCRAAIRENLDGWRHQVDFLFADPPFNIGHEYDEYQDIRDDDEFQDFMRQWLALACYLPRTGGLFAVHVPDSLVGLVLDHFSHLPNWKRIDWIIWHYRFGQCQRAKFISSKAHCLIFRNGLQAAHTFNDSEILVPSDRAAIYSDSRTHDSATPGLRVPLDVWCTEYDGTCWGRVTGNSLERDGLSNHPNQLPEKYLERLLRAYTSEYDLVFDPFGGTGTTAVVSQALQRRFITTELSKQYCADIQERLDKGAVRL